MTQPINEGAGALPSGARVFPLSAPVADPGDVPLVLNENQRYGTMQIYCPGVDEDMLYLDEVPARRERWKFLTEDYKNKCRPLGKDPDQTRIYAEVAAECIDATIRRVTRNHQRSGQLIETSLASNFAGFQRVALIPTVFELWPRLLATELFATQPMAIPVAPIFFESTRLFSTGGNPPATTVEGHDANYSADPGEGVAVKKLQIKYTSTSVTAIARKVQTEMSAEAIQDAQALYGLNLSARAQQAAINQLAMEVDIDCITNCISNTTQSVTFNAYTSQTLPTEIRAYRDTLYDAIIDANATIATRKYRSANWIVCNETDAARIRKTAGFQPTQVAAADSRGDSTDQNIGQGSRLLGTVSPFLRVYTHPWIAAGTYLMGYRGPSPVFDAGYVFAPYVREFVTPDTWDPSKLLVSRSHMVRYGKIMVDANQFCKITVQNPSNG